MPHRRSDFISSGDRVAGFLSTPTRRPKGVRLPTVLMAHGFGAQMDFRLPAFAAEFVKRGFAVYRFDYRSFGLSEGEPRNYVHPGRHKQDWMRAIEHVREQAEVDPERLALWGTSFSGGHVLACAARDRRLRAVSVLVPFVSGPATVLHLGPAYAIRATVRALLDLVRAAIGLAPYRVPIIAPPDRFGLMNRPDSESGYRAMIPAGSDWENSCPARIALLATAYRPGAAAKSIACPVLVVLATNDSLIPAGAVRRVARRIPRSEILELPIGHFDAYRGEFFRQTVQAQCDFLTKNVLES